MSEFQTFWDNKWKKLSKLDIGPTSFALKISKYINENSSILDIGCGTGRDSLYFSKSNKTVGLDFSKIAIDKLSNFLSENKYTYNLDLIHNDIESYFQNNIETFDLIYSCNSLHYFDLRTFKDTLKLIYGSLNKGGFLCIRVKSIDDGAYGKGICIEDNYYNNNGDLKYFFSENIFKEIFTFGDIIYLENQKEKHNKIDGEIIQTGYIDIIVQKND